MVNSIRSKPSDAIEVKLSLVGHVKDNCQGLVSLIELLASVPNASFQPSVNSLWFLPSTTWIPPTIQLATTA